MGETSAAEPSGGRGTCQQPSRQAVDVSAARRVAEHQRHRASANNAKARISRRRETGQAGRCKGLHFIRRAGGCNSPPSLPQPLHRQSSPIAVSRLRALAANPRKLGTAADAPASAAVNGDWRIWSGLSVVRKARFIPPALCKCASPCISPRFCPVPAICFCQAFAFVRTFARAVELPPPCGLLTRPPPDGSAADTSPARLTARLLTFPPCPARPPDGSAADVSPCPGAFFSPPCFRLADFI